MWAIPSPFPALPASLSERLVGWRTRWIADRRFQKWAAKFPLTRRVARRKASALFDLCAGFVYAQTLRACVELDVFRRLERGPACVGELAAGWRMSDDSARRLLKAAVALELLRALPNERFALGDLGAALLCNPSIADFVRHHDLFYADMKDPVALLRGQVDTELARFWPYAGDRPYRAPRPEAETRRYADYSRLMANSQAMIAEDILDAYPVAHHRRLLDVGGGEGAFVAAAARRAPRLRLALFDLPPVADRARAALALQGLGGRVEVTEGSALVDPLPTGADLVTLIRVLHDHDDESALRLLRAAWEALPKGGVVLIAEPMSGLPDAQAMSDAYFGFYLLAMGRGRARTAAEIEALARQAGFARTRKISTRRPLLTAALVARRV